MLKIEKNLKLIPGPIISKHPSARKPYLIASQLVSEFSVCGLSMDLVNDKGMLLTKKEFDSTMWERDSKRKVL